VEGFVYSGSITVDNNNTKRKHLKLNSDYLHCIKKFVNVTDTGRTLVMGDYIVTLSLVSSIMEHCNRADHGLHTTDHKRKGYDQMDVPSCIRLLSLRVHVCLEDCITGFAGSARVPLLPCVPQTQLIGIQTYLDTLRRFAEMFMSRKLKHAERVRSAGYVVTFFRLWRLWLLRCTTHTLEAAYVTKEGRVDCALACHFVVLWLMVCRDDFPFHEPNLYRTGTDVCEKFFSHIGGFIANRRVYTFLEALQTLRTFITSELAYAGGIERATKRKRRIPTWDELPDNHVRNGNQLEYPDDAEMAAQWTAGCNEARECCRTVGIRPPGSSAPEWWTHPHRFDPTDGGHSAGNDEGADDDEEKEDEDDNNDDNDEENEDDDTARESSSDSDVDGDDPSPEDDAEAGVHEAVEALEAVDDMKARGTFPMSLPVPDCGNIHKTRIVKWLAGEVPTLTADRTRRVAQIHSDGKTSEGQAQALLSEQDWWVGQGDDVAVLTENHSYWIGRVLMVKKRFKTKGGKAKFVQYKNRVVIHEGREDLGDLLFHCQWYEAKEHTVRAKRGVRAGKETRYTFNVKDVNPVELSNVICPCAMVYHHAEKYFTISKETEKVLRKGTHVSPCG
jgi:hypothetical protein